MAYKINKQTGELTTFTVSEQVQYNAKRSKKGTRDRNGKPLSDFRRGQALGKAQGLSEGAKIANKVKKQRQHGQQSNNNRPPMNMNY